MARNQQDIDDEAPVDAKAAKKAARAERAAARKQAREERAAAQKAAQEEKAAERDKLAAEKEQASKDKKDKKNKKSEKKGGLLGKLILTVIFLGLIGLLVAVIGFNFLGAREKYLRGVIDKIPVVNTLLPAPEAAEADERLSMSNAELIAQIESLQSELEQAAADNEDLRERIDLYTAELTSLREIEAQQEQFKQDKAAFDEMIAVNDPAAYAKFYESISPENADILYREVVGTQQTSKEVSKYISSVTAMDERAAAAMLENLLLTDMDLVVMILRNMPSDSVGAIVESMSPTNAATVIKQLAPVQNN